MWRDSEGGPIRVQAPVAGPDKAAIYRTADGIRARLTAEGVPEALVEVVSYDAGPARDAPIVVGYLHHQVELPRCGESWNSLTRSMTNKVQSNFGCAVTANMAAQIANPEDLINPRDSTPVDAQRRATVLDKYRRGEITSSARDDQAAGAISRAVN